MKRILYNGGTVMTGDEIADAVIEYASELARHESSATVEISTITRDGERSHAQLLLGPASQLVVEPMDAAGIEDPLDPEFVAEVGRKTTRLKSPHPIAVADRSGYPIIDDPTEVPDPPLADA